MPGVNWTAEGKLNDFTPVSPIANVIALVAIGVPVKLPFPYTFNVAVPPAVTECTFTSICVK